MREKRPSGEQSKRFVDAARELGCDESEPHFEEKLKKVARHKPAEPATKKDVSLAQMREVRMAEDRNRALAYLHELSELGRKHGFGLAGEIQIYGLERDDYLFDYFEDSEGFLRLGDAHANAAAGTGRDSESRFNPDARPNVDKKCLGVA